MRTSTKQLWFLIVNTTIDTHFLIYTLYVAVKDKQLAVWISAAAIITALWTFCTVMYNNNNNRKAKENVQGVNTNG